LYSGIYQAFPIDITDSDKNQQRIHKIKEIEDDLNENNQTVNDVGNNKSKKKNKKSKNKPKKKNAKDGSMAKPENESKKLYEINDIDLLCDMIENPNKAKGKDAAKSSSKQRKKSKTKKLKSNSPEDKVKNSKNKDKEEMGKENKPNNDHSHTSKPTKTGHSKNSQHEPPKEGKSSDVSGCSDDCKEIEDLKEFLKNCCTSKRKVLIKPNIPIKWITDLKAKLAKIQTK
jgi:hypothetical protein